ncbi:MAG: hypothetical protein HRT58_04575 [Crocinitomicaceae bacterium]|nr:hypothetical protein [Flavobacteriales bacterium]NQZ34912.1 hypothetical protein [Crocinitomicaceae bacterium]
MTISGFTMVRNADNYYFPIEESIRSILPIVDEFIVALGDNAEDDRTREKIEAIGSDKIKIYDRVWSEQEFVDGKIFANETSFALDQCSGDWCFYLQADEVVHEKDLDAIVAACEQHQNDSNVHGLLFDYYHFFGDYDHYLPFHGWYKNEIRIVKNNTSIYSYKDAQSFRRKDNEKLNVVKVKAHIYHYGWVRPPELMQSKKKEQDSMHHGREVISGEYQLKPNEFDYGPLGKISDFKGTHPEVMNDLMARIEWKHKLNQSKVGELNRPAMKHEQPKYRFLSSIERMIGRDFFPYTNWNKVK